MGILSLVLVSNHTKLRSKNFLTMAEEAQGVTILIQDIYPIFAKKAMGEVMIKPWSQIGILLTLGFDFFATLFARDVIDYISNVIGSIIPGVSVTMLLGAC